MQLITTKKELKSYLDSHEKTKTIGFVPTMGALHMGHMALVKRSVEENDLTLVSIFVNPTQFNNKEDLDKYPSTLEADLALLKGVSDRITVFAPSASEIYSGEITSKTYDFEGLENVMEGEFRDNHFNGVGTIVETLFSLVKPKRAYFGEKDFQQLRIIQKLVEIQKIPVEIIGCEIVRENHGLAMSSRNERLSTTIRQNAAFIYETLKIAKYKFGMESVLKVKDWVAKQFDNSEDFKLEYFEITDVETLTPAKNKNIDIKYRAFIAVYVEGVRLIDNIAIN